MSDHKVIFGTLHPDGSMSDQRSIKQSDIKRCPHLILTPEHYRDDGTCRCDDPDHTSMRQWGYRWHDTAWE